MDTPDTRTEQEVGMAQDLLEVLRKTALVHRDSLRIFNREARRQQERIDARIAVLRVQGRRGQNERPCR